MGGNLYQAGRHGVAARFIAESCTTGSDALALWKKPSDSSGVQGLKDVWKQLEEQLHKRYELLGVCYSKISDRAVSFALSQAYSSN